MLVQIKNLIDDKKCYESVRELRWSESIKCPHCKFDNVIKQGFDETEKERQRYFCKACNKKFDDLTNTVFSNSHHSLKTWILCLYLMNLNLSNRQISKELEISEKMAQSMTERLRCGIDENKEEVILNEEVECDEVYIVAGHKGNPEAVKKKVDWVVEED